MINLTQEFDMKGYTLDLQTQKLRVVVLAIDEELENGFKCIVVEGNDNYKRGEIINVKLRVSPC
ncbi:hypothetical protein SD71_10845 [Cohnella kolymensis]|uniref:Uncharacterized protein n=1 Tax=Cohnella kolymensis TaxID=1590652 RepID=A0ABR5A4A7_9BACL|nr:hypothetical protein [Cohnella kolymensis]KIL35878.1 hypothetical protein SD71_10845 [Cohnella kolymensis]